MKIVLAGATGFIGKALRSELLLAGHELVVLTRGASSDAGREKFVTWDGVAFGEWASQLDGADAVINLVGENIAAKRWTAERKEKLLSSRVGATRILVAAIGQARKKPAVLINASAVGYYGPCPRSSRKVDKDRPNFQNLEIDKYWDGDVPDLDLTETSSRGEGFLAETCEQWEYEARKAECLGVRVILARLGPVLGENGGMLSKMIPPFRFFVGAPLGTGKQWISWVHREDVTGSFLFMLSHRELSGPVNVTSPAPVTMNDFSVALAGALRRPCWFPIPAFLLKRVLGEMAGIVLEGQRAIPRKLLDAGYEYRYGALSAALGSILKKRA